MNVLGFLRWALKKPVIIVVVIACALVGGYQGYRSTTSHYETTSAVLVIPPGAGNQNAGMNPFTNLTTGTAQTAFVLTTAAQTEEAREAVAKTGASPNYLIASVAGEGSFAQLSSQITFTISADDPWVAKAGAQALATWLRNRLQKMQKDAGVLDGTYADLRVPTEPAPGVEVGGNGLRAAIGLAMGAALAALLLCLIVTAALEAVRKRRASSRKSDGAPPVEAGGVSEVAIGSGSGSGSEAAPDAVDGPLAGLAGGTAPAAPAAATPVALRPLGRAAQLAMTRWRDHVEEVPAETEFPLPDLADADPTGTDGPNGPRATTSQ